MKSNQNTPSFTETLEPRTLLAGGTASIYGRVFRDWNRNGLRDDAHEIYVSHVVYIDANNNAQRDAGELQTTGNAKGSYQFNNLAGGTYRLRIDGPVDLVITPPAPTGKVVNVSDGQALTTANIGTTFASTILGRVYRDDDGDGKRDLFEDPIKGRVVWLDLDGDAVFDSVEPYARTNSIGRYQFSNVYSGTYFVRVTVGKGEAQTSPIRGRAAAVSVFGASSGAIADFLVAPANLSITGSVLNDVEGDGSVTENNAQAVGSVPVYIDTNNNRRVDSGEPITTADKNGAYRFDGLRRGTYYVRAAPTPGWRWVPHSINGDYVELISTSGSWDVFVSKTSVISGTVLNLIDIGPGSYSVFADLNGNGALDSAEPSKTIAQAFSDHSWELTVPRAGTYTLRLLTPPGVIVTNPSNNALRVSVGTATARRGIDFTVAYA